MGKNIELNTVGDLVAHVAKLGEYSLATRWRLETSNEIDLLHPVTGHKISADWRGEHHGEAVDMGGLEPIRASYTTYRLDEKSSSYRPSHIILGRELGEAIAAIWPTEKPWARSDYTRMAQTQYTLMGLLKRLGADKGIAAQIKERQAAEAALKAKNARNWQRTHAIEQLDAAREAVKTCAGALSAVDLAAMVGMLEASISNIESTKEA